MVKLSICICVFNKFNFTKSCVEDLSNLPSDHEIIIVDNGSTDQTQSYFTNSKEIIYFRNNENGGFAKGSNKAYQLSSGENIMFLNNDIRVTDNKSDWTFPIIDKCDSGLVGPTMGQLNKDLEFVKEANEVLPGNSYMSGWCLSSSRDVWKQLEQDDQIFDESYFAYYEDTDLSFRAKKLKIPFHVVDIPVVHFGKQTSKQLNTRQLYLNSQKIFMKKWRGK